MKKSFSTILALTLLFAWLVPVITGTTAEARTFSQEPTKNPVKPWTITFSKAVDSTTENLNRIYVQSADNKKLKISIKVSADLKKVTVIPENHYIFSETYTLVIPKGFKSADGQQLSEDTTMLFNIEGKYIEEITATYNSLATNIRVKGAVEIAKAEVSINNAPTDELISNGTYFSKGFLGLAKGDHVTVYVYDQNNNLLETQYYNVK